MVYHRKGVHRTAFRNAPFGEWVVPTSMLFYIGAKCGRRMYAGIYDPSIGTLVGTILTVNTEIRDTPKEWEPYDGRFLELD